MSVVDRLELAETQTNVVAYARLLHIPRLSANSSGHMSAASGNLYAIASSRHAGVHHKYHSHYSWVGSRFAGISLMFFADFKVLLTLCSIFRSLSRVQLRRESVNSKYDKMYSHIKTPK